MPKVSVCMPVYNEPELVIKALDSIPDREDIEIVIVEDCSTDNTYQNIVDYINSHPHRDIKLFKNDVNRGNGFSTNRCFDEATGDWMVEFGSDDYMLTEDFSDVMDKELDPEYQLVYFNLVDNKGKIYRSFENYRYVGAVKFINREWLGDLRGEPYRLGNDTSLSYKMWDRKPNMKYTDRVLVHWNYPDKVGTLSWKVKHHLIDSHGHEIRRMG